MKKSKQCKLKEKIRQNQHICYDCKNNVQAKTKEYGYIISCAFSILKGGYTILECTHFQPILELNEAQKDTDLDMFGDD